MAVERLVEAPGIADVAALERTPAHRPLVALPQGVETPRREARLGQRLADMAADIARAAGHQDSGAHRAMVPGEGFEPPTFGLQNRCTTTVLTRPTFEIIIFAPPRPFIGGDR